MGSGQASAQRAPARRVIRRSLRVVHTDAPVLEVYDVDPSETEDRFKSIGPIRGGLALVVWTDRADDIARLVSAWWTTRAEQELNAEYVENLR